MSETYTDNDTGASSKSQKVRKAYARMIADAKAGKFDIILAYSTSRLTRRPMEYEELIQLSERHKVKIRTIASGDDDLSTADGQFVARIKSAQDAAESARISERVSRKALENARTGKFGGGRRPFGFEPDGETIRPTEAAEIRKATQTILAGGSLRSIVRDWNEGGVKTTAGKEWTPLAVRDLLVRPRNAGLIKYKPTEWDENGTRKINRSPESFGPASWEPIVSDDERLAVVAILSDPKRKTSPGNQPTYLGSSIYLCGVCGSKVRTTASGNRATRYVCNGGKGTGPNHLSRNADKTDLVVNAQAAAFIAGLIQAAKDKGATRKVVTPEWSALTSELTAVQHRATDIQQDYADGYITRVDFRTMMDRNREREAEIREKMSTGPETHIPMFDDIQPSEVWERWNALDIDQRRKAISSAVTVTILPTDKRGSAAFDPDAIQLELKLGK